MELMQPKLQGQPQAFIFCGDMVRLGGNCIGGLAQRPGHFAMSAGRGKDTLSFGRDRLDVSLRSKQPEALTEPPHGPICQPGMEFPIACLTADNSCL